MDALNESSISQIFTTVLQHAKCIEIRLEYAKAVTNQKQKYVLSNALTKINHAINTICDLLPDSNAVLKVKKELDKADLVYVMLLTEQLAAVTAEDKEELVEYLQNFIDKKYNNVP